MNLKSQLDQLAEILLNAACVAAPPASKPADGTEEMTVKERVDIFKATAAYYLGVKKSRKGDPGDDSLAGTFADLQQRINGKGITQ